MAYKMNGFSGFGNSPLEQDEETYTASDTTAAVKIGGHVYDVSRGVGGPTPNRDLAKMKKTNPKGYKIYEGVRGNVYSEDPKLYDDSPEALDMHTSRRLRKLQRKNK